MSVVDYALLEME